MRSWIVRLSHVSIPSLVMYALFAAVFLGDGKQPVVDVFLSVCVGVLFVFALQRNKIRPLPRPIAIAWMVFLGYVFVHVWISDSVGYSISWMVRALLGYLVFVLFYSFSTKERLKTFATSLVFLGAVGIGISLVLLGFPVLAKGMPLMNLLYPVYGHNHLADLLLFGFPIVLLRTKKSFWSGGLLSWYLLGFAMTFARGAWLLVALLFLWWVLTYIKIGQRVRGLGIVIAIVFLVGAVGLSIVPSAQRGFPSHSDNPFIKLFIKSPLPIEGRFAYWRQALTAIQERPWFGSGPGTFSLQSKRLQRHVDSYSWFAHSFPLQTMVELGVVGTIPLIALMVFIARAAWNSKKILEESPDYQGLVLGAGLTLVYSFYEFNLDYVVVWLFWWATLGILVGLNPATVKQSKNSTTTAVAIVTVLYLALYYVTYIASLVVSVWSAMGAIFVAPYRVDPALSASQEHISKNIQNFILFFHKKNPDVIFAQMQKSKDASDSQYQMILILDPKNWKYYKEYLNYLKSNGTRDDRLLLLLRLTQNILPSGFSDDIESDFFRDPSAQALDSKFSLLDDASSTEEALQKVYYFSGLDLLQTNPLTTKQFWIIARDLFPTWGYYHMELASLEYHTLSDPDTAKNTLAYCQQFPYVADWCASTRLEDLNEPGDFQNNIQAIPRILP